MPEADDLRGFRLSLLQGRAGRPKAQAAPESEPDESMNSRVSWSVEGIEPSVRERAEAAARRAGMSLNDWLNSTIGDTPPNFRKAPDQRGQLPSQDARNVAEIHQRLELGERVEDSPQDHLVEALDRELQDSVAVHVDKQRIAACQTAIVLGAG